MKKTYTTSDFNYFLPEALIARYPLDIRSASRMLALNRDSGQIDDRRFVDFVNMLSSKDLIVFNDTRVIPARLHGRKLTGGKLECFVERVLSANSVLAHVRASRSPKVGAVLVFSDKFSAKVTARREALFELEFMTEESVYELLDTHGQLPIPPYFDRSAETLDEERYQTIFAHRPGAVAAPTASLHFDEQILQQIHLKGIQTAMVTLHVGAGTFQPVRTELIQEHTMHTEYLEVSDEVCKKVKQVRSAGGRVVAVGTTVVRSLETASKSGSIQPFRGETQLFINPGYQFNCVDVMLTNFHLPKSTLLMLVCAFGGYEHVMSAYSHAIKEQYRFFSYGDAMVVYC